MRPRDDDRLTEAGARPLRSSGVIGLSHQLPEFVLSLGLFCILTGLIWTGDRSLYNRLFYWLVILPTVCAVFCSRQALFDVLKSRIFIAYLPFASYMVMTMLWSEGEENAVDLIKRVVFAVLFFCFVFEFGRRYSARLIATIRWSAVFSVLAAVYLLYLFVSKGGQGRLGGIGPLSNPLLVSHVFGFFLALWLGHYFFKQRFIEPVDFCALAVLGSLIFATGSRTPLMATAVTVVWLTLLSANRKAVSTLLVFVIVGGSVCLLFPEAITQRGLSYRTVIWMDTIRQIGDDPWFGHGIGTPIRISVEALNQTFVDPHNLTLAVLYSGGLLGGTLWCVIYFTALREAWRWRRDQWTMISSATVVYGLVAGLSEGGSFLSRPKEHWSLILIPLTLLAYATFRAGADTRVQQVPTDLPD